MKCSNCYSTEMHTDLSRGSIYCGECGMVQEENTVVSALQFDSASTKAVLHGKMINVENTNIGTGYTDSSYYIKNTIRSICQKLSLGLEHSECAFRWYKLCLQHSLSKGKSILYTLSACIYLTCRQEGTPHLLIDFSNELRIDLFKIGKVFLKIRNLLGADVQLIDPSLYMHRFVSQLKFKNKEILNFSMLLISRMKKDWILEGRRPNNSCGAALLIASRIFNEERTLFEVAKVVHASVMTINKRLEEIMETESSNLQIEDFKNIWIEKEENPPVFKRHQAQELDLLYTPEQTQELINKDEIDFENFKLISTEIIVSKNTKDCFDSDEFVLNEEEAKTKEQMWDTMYAEYMEEATIKRKNRKKSIKKHSKRHNFDTVEEAFNSLDRKVSSKLNYAALESLFDP